MNLSMSGREEGSEGQYLRAEDSVEQKRRFNFFVVVKAIKWFSVSSV
jgi:hypothetical protein